MRNLPTRVAAAAVLALALSPGLGLPARAGEPAVHEDPDYRFRIESPGPGWRLLPQAEARRAVPDALAGMSDLKSAYYFVIAEEAPGVDLDAFVRMVQGGMQVEDPTFGEVEVLEYQGCPARRWGTEGRVKGLRARYRHLVFLRGPFAYQLIGYTLLGAVPAGAAPDLDLLARCLFLTEGEIRPRKLVATTHDVSGVGWRVKDGVYQDAASGVEVKPPAGWRLAVGAELRTMNDSACVGLIAADPEVFVVVIVERARGEDPEAFVARVRAGFGEGGESVGDPAMARVGDREFEFRSFRVAAEMPIRMHHAVRYDDACAVQVLWWCVDGLVDRARPRVASALAAVRFLGDPERAALARDLRAAGDPEDAVGPAFCLRGGVYRDFGQGFTWTKPAGFWVVSAGQDARAENADATILMEDPSTGLYAVVIAEEASGLEPVPFHRLVVDGLEPVGGAPEPRPVSLSGAEALVSEVAPGVTDLPMRYVVATVVRGGRAYQYLLWGLAGNVAAARKEFDATLQALAFPERLVADERVEGAWVDHRMGFTLRRPPGEGWRFERITPQPIAPLANLVLFTRRSSVLLGGAICALTEGQDEQFVRDVLLRLARERLGAGDEAPEETATTVAGHPARRLVLGGLRRMTAWIIQRQRTFYLLVAGGGPLAGFDPEDAPSLLELLD